MRRTMIVAAVLLASTSPALAATRNADDAEMARMADALNDPLRQSAISGMMVAMADVLMDLRVDKLRAAIERVDPDTRSDSNLDSARTLGDIIARDDPNFRSKIENGSRMAVGTMGAAAGSMADMMPELRQMSERMRRDIEQAIKRLPRD